MLSPWSYLGFIADLKVIHVHVSLKIVGNSGYDVQITFYSCDLIGLDSLVSPVLAHSFFWLWLVSISGEGSLLKMTLSDASKINIDVLFIYIIEVFICYILKYYQQSISVTTKMDITLVEAKNKLVFKYNCTPLHFKMPHSRKSEILLRKSLNKFLLYFNFF